MEIKSLNREILIKEMPYIDAIDIDPENKREMIQKMFKASSDLTDEEINKLTLKEGQEVEKAIIEVNGLSQDFLEPTEKKES